MQESGDHMGSCVGSKASLDREAGIIWCFVTLLSVFDRFAFDRTIIGKEAMMNFSLYSG